MSRVKVRTIKPLSYAGRKCGVNVILTVKEDMAELLIREGYVELGDKPKETPEPQPEQKPKPVETASIDTGEKAVEKKPKPKKVLR